MELKDLIKQTLDEFATAPSSPTTEDSFPKKPSDEDFEQKVPENNITLHIDSKFLEILREKTLVLFEGLQSSQTKDLSSKLDLVINYLEYQLSLIDEALQN